MPQARTIRINSAESQQPDNVVKMPEGFTGRSLAQYLGVHEDSIRKTYYKEALEIYQACPEKLITGNQYSEIARDEFFRMRQLRFTTKLLLNDKTGEILRNEPSDENPLGAPVLIPNNRISRLDYRDMRWREQPELKAAPRPNSVEEAVVTEVVDAEITDGLAIYDSDRAQDFSLQLDQLDQLGEDMGAFISDFRGIGHAMADNVTAEITTAFNERLNSNLAKFRDSVGNAVNPKKKKP